MAALSAVLAGSGNIISSTAAPWTTWGNAHSIGAGSSGYIAFAAAYGNGQYVVLSNNPGVGYAVKISTSPDGVTWTDTDGTAALGLTYDAGDYNYNVGGTVSMVFAGGRFILVMRQSTTGNTTAGQVRLLTSTDGLTWTEGTDPTKLPWLSGTGNNMGLGSSMATDGNTVLLTTRAGGSDAAVGAYTRPIYRSTDGGLTWTGISIPGLSVSNDGHFVDCVGYADDIARWMLFWGGSGIGGRASYTSDDDGLTWTLRGAPPNLYPTNGNCYFALAYSHGVWSAAYPYIAGITSSTDANGTSWSGMGYNETVTESTTACAAGKALGYNVDIEAGSNEVQVYTTHLANLTSWTIYAVVLGGSNAPLAPTGLTPVSGLAFNRTQVQRLSWTNRFVDAGDSQQRFEIRYRPVGSATWTTLISSAVANAYYDAPAYTFDPGIYEWQVRTFNSVGISGPFSVSSQFVVGTPNAPIADVTQDSVPVGAKATVMWPYSDPEGLPQTKFQIRYRKEI